MTPTPAQSSAPGYSFRPPAYQSADPDDLRAEDEASDRPPQRTDPTATHIPAATWQVRSSGSFPVGLGWEVNEANAERWNRHQFASILNSSKLERCTKNGVDHNELHLLRLDLLAWEDLNRRGKAWLPLHEALLEGREHWGNLTGYITALRNRDLTEYAEELDEEPNSRAAA